jgi:hypothetical protein
MDSVPHLALPLRVQADAYASVQQDTLDEVRTTVAAIVAFPVGYRIEAPDFGVPDRRLRRATRERRDGAAGSQRADRR